MPDNQHVVHLIAFNDLSAGTLVEVNDIHLGLDDLKRQVALIRKAANATRNKADQANLDAIADFLSDLEALGRGSLSQELAESLLLVGRAPAALARDALRRERSQTSD